MSMCESILTIALVCTVKYLHYCDYYYTLGNDSQSTPKLIAPILVKCDGQRHAWVLGDVSPIIVATEFDRSCVPCTNHLRLDVVWFIVIA